MHFGSRSNLCRGCLTRAPTILTKREKQAMDYATACAYDAHAFSISFDVTARRVKALIYFDQPKVVEHGSTNGADKENERAAPAAHGPRTVPAQRPSPPRKPQVPLESTKQAQKQAQKQAPSKVDRNALSACSSSNLLSDAALAAQARVDSAKQPESKRRRRALAQPAHEPAPAHEPTPR